MSHITITEGAPVSIDECKRLWDAVSDEKKFPVSYEGEREAEARYLGLAAPDGIDSALHAGFFVGFVKIGDYVIEATPRFEGLDFARMFSACAEDPVVAQHLSDTLFVWPAEEEWIEVEPARWFAPLLVIAFLRALHELCRRHLRRNYVRVVENLTGRIRGRIRVGEHIQRNLVRQRLDCTVCEYGRFDDDCLENRILRGALEVSAAFVARNGVPHAAYGWIAACRVALSRVPITRIQSYQFRGVRQTGSFRHYRYPIRLAWAVLQHLGISPENLGDASQSLRVPPFALCTYELFERYTEAMLRRQHQAVWAGYGTDNLGRDRYRVRPDFLLIREREIVDCKYKRFKPDLDDNERADAYQIVSYSRHRGVLEKLCSLGDTESPTRLTLMYPEVVTDQSLWGQVGKGTSDNSFEMPLVRRPLYCPRLDD